MTTIVLVVQVAMGLMVGSAVFSPGRHTVGSGTTTATAEESTDGLPGDIVLDSSAGEASTESLASDDSSQRTASVRTDSTPSQDRVSVEADAGDPDVSPPPSDVQSTSPVPDDLPAIGSEDAGPAQTPLLASATTDLQTGGAAADGQTSDEEVAPSADQSPEEPISGAPEEATVDTTQPSAVESGDSTTTETSTDAIDPSVGEPEPEAPAITLGEFPVQIFPLLGGGGYSSSFGAPRDGGKRQHKGNDIFAPKLTPVLAVSAGTVVGAPRKPGEKCCYLKIEHADGSVTVYLHLNNDTPGTDDGQGWGLADGMKVGVHVEAGDVIGYVGDSGNAENTDPHLHFEYRPDGVDAIDPYPYLQAAPIMTSLEGSLAASASSPASTPGGAAETAAAALPYTGVDADLLALLGMLLLASGSIVLRHNDLRHQEVGSDTRSES